MEALIYRDPPVIIKTLGFFGYNPYVNKGNWGYEHQKSCKSTGSGTTPSPLGKCSGTTVATLNAKISSARLTTNSKSLDLTLNPDGTTDQFTANAIITITSTTEDVDFTKLTLSEKLEISSITGTIKNAGGTLTIDTQLSAGDQLTLEASGTINNTPVKGNVNLTGTIKVTSTGSHNLGTQLQFGGGPSGGNVTGSVTLKDATGESGNQYVNITGNLTISSTALTSLKDASGTLKIGTTTPDDVVKYKLVTENSIILGLSTLNNINASAKVTLKLPSLPQIKIAPTGSNAGIKAESGFGTTVTISKTDNNFGTLKTPSGITLNLAQAFAATITKSDDGLLTTGEQLEKGTELNISGGTTSDSVQINANIKVISQGKSLNGATNCQVASK